MIQTFQCPVCGTPVMIGETTCKACGETFSYNCPVCGFSIDNRFTYCPNCRAELNWITHLQTSIESVNTSNETDQYKENSYEESHKVPQTKEPARGSKKTRIPTLWLTLIFICILLIIIVLAIDRIVNVKP